MTKCTGKPLLFSSLRRQKVVADFTGGRLTSDAGGLLLREVDRRCGLTAALVWFSRSRSAIQGRETQIVALQTQNTAQQEQIAALEKRLDSVEQLNRSTQPRLLVPSTSGNWLLCGAMVLVGLALGRRSRIGG